MPPNDDSRPLPAARPRMADVAREAGVSLVTVSRAINQPEKVAPDTLTQVRAAIERLRYVPNLTAGSLASNRSRIIAAVVPMLASSIFSDTIDSLSQVVADAGYQLLIGQTRFDSTEEVRIVDAFIGRRVDGLVLIRSGSGRRVDERLAAAAIPFVQAWEIGTDDVDLAVGFMNHDAGVAAGRFLVTRGYRRLGYVGSAHGRSRARRDGLALAAREAGQREPATVTIGTLDALTFGAAAVAVLRDQHPDVEAVLCANDMVGAGIVFECQRRGLRVPEDLAVMGFGDLGIAGAMVPTLSTVQISSRMIGRQAGLVLLDRLGVGGAAGAAGAGAGPDGRRAGEGASGRADGMDEAGADRSAEDSVRESARESGPAEDGCSSAEGSVRRSPTRRIAVDVGYTIVGRQSA